VECVPVLDDALTLAFVNPLAIQPGALLVIPKRHVATIIDISDEEAIALMRAVRVLSRALSEVLDPAGLTVFQNNGVASDQAVPHVHIHLVPRYPNDGGTFRTPERVSLTDREALASQVQHRLADFS
jgi:histidine triad (HIT) family protein